MSMVPAVGIQVSTMETMSTISMKAICIHPMEITMTNTEAPRRTRQREMIETYLGRVDEFRNAQQVYDGLRTAGTPVSLPTVYRTLASMAESGDLDVLSIEGMASYRQCSPDHHHHLT